MPGQQFRGRWLVDGPVFEPCGAPEKWWAVLDSNMQTRVIVETTLVYIQSGSTAVPKSPIPESPPVTFVIVRGDTSTPGEYGAQGEYRRRLLVHKIRFLGPFKPADCR